MVDSQHTRQAADSNKEQAAHSDSEREDVSLLQLKASYSNEHQLRHSEPATAMSISCSFIRTSQSN